ncbi:MAG: GGDEF domain-containing protein [Aeromonas sp.]
MFSVDNLSQSFIEKFPGFLSIRDENHKIVFLNSNFLQWIDSLIKLNPIGMTNEDIITLLDGNDIAKTFKQCHDLSLEYIKDNEKSNKIISFYNVDIKKDIFLDVTKFKSAINGKPYIYTIAIDITDAYNEMLILKRKASQDSLTHAYNRTILDTLSINDEHLFIYIDLDNFKKINDSVGHLKGDEVLCEAVDIFRASVRVNDLVIRMGGDEFLLILDNLSMQRALAIIDNIANQFNEKFSAHYPFLSFSYGISHFCGSINQTLEKIDHEMYQHKIEKKEKKEKNE